MSTTAVSLEELLTANEVARILRVSPAQVYLLKDRIGHVVVGSRAIRFEPHQVMAYVESQRRCHEPAVASSAAPAPRSGTPYGPTMSVPRIVSPQVAEIMALHRSGLPPEN